MKTSRRNFLKSIALAAVGVLAGVTKVRAEENPSSEDGQGVQVDGRDIVTQPLDEFSKGVGFQGWEVPMRIWEPPPTYSRISVNDAHRFVDDMWVFPLEEVELEVKSAEMEPSACWDDLPDGPVTVGVGWGHTVSIPTIADHGRTPNHDLGAWPFPITDNPVAWFVYDRYDRRRPTPGDGECHHLVLYHYDTGDTYYIDGCQIECPTLVERLVFDEAWTHYWDGLSSISSDEWSFYTWFRIRERSGGMREIEWMREL